MILRKFTGRQKLQASLLKSTIAYYLQSRQKGFTIIESLMALVVVSVLLAAIAPVITLSVATRLQSRQVELATQAAKAYIDGLRAQQVLIPTSTGTNTIQGYAAPTATGSLTCVANSYCTVPTGTSLYCVDFDGSGGCEVTSLTDMIVQAFRPDNTTTASGFPLGVRVYRAHAFKLSTVLVSNTTTTKTTQKTFTGGAGQRHSPLVEMTTEINDMVPKYSELCARLNGCTN